MRTPPRRRDPSITFRVLAPGRIEGAGIIVDLATKPAHLNFREHIHASLLASGTRFTFADTLAGSRLLRMSLSE
jgi:hypothetical protein